jgi:ubiquinone/menaquinone biosynthesis C-methylase UbiE
LTRPVVLKQRPCCRPMPTTCSMHSGILELQLADPVNYMVGIDISQTMIAIAKARQAGSNKRNVDFVVADIEKPPFREGTFDFVVSKGLLHNTWIDLTLSSLSRLAKPRGRMVICDFVTLNPRLDKFPPMACITSPQEGSEACEILWYSCYVAFVIVSNQPWMGSTFM